MNHARPQARQIREREQSEDRPKLRLIRVREQSPVASSPRHRSRQQSVRSRDKDTISTGRNTAVATDMDTPQTDRNSEPAAAAASPLTGIGRAFEQVTNCPSHYIAVAISPLTCFPVHIRTIPTNVLI